MPASTHSAQALLNLFLRGVSYTPPSLVYVSLHTDDPGAGGANEVTGTDWPAYVRREASGGAGVADGFSAPTGKATDNAQELLWPANDGAAPLTVTHFGIWDSASGGNLLFYGELTRDGGPDPKTLNPTDELVLHEGELDLEVI
jgi:hypothetical protein